MKRLMIKTTASAVGLAAGLLALAAPGVANALPTGAGTIGNPYTMDCTSIAADSCTIDFPRQTVPAETEDYTMPFYSCNQKFPFLQSGLESSKRLPAPSGVKLKVRDLVVPQLTAVDRAVNGENWATGNGGDQLINHSPSPQDWALTLVCTASADKAY